MQNLFKNINQLTDEMYEGYNVKFSSSQSGWIFTKDGYLRRNIAKEFDLKVISCDYRDDSFEDIFGRGKYRFGNKMSNFLKLLENDFGRVEICEEVLGFILNIGFEVEGKKCVYIICSGNNGQEVCVHMLLEDIDTIDTMEYKKIIQYLDYRIYEKVIKSKLHYNFY